MSPRMPHDEFIRELLKDDRAQSCLKAALERKRKGTMLPIGDYITPELLESITPEMTGWMIDIVQRSDASETQNVFDAIKGSSSFMHLLSAAMHSVDAASEAGAMTRKQALAMLVSLMLMCGWKLAERAMEGLAEKSVSA